MTLNLQNSKKDVVLVTGFGPFRFHEVNASWEAVKLLQDYNNDKFSIITEQIPVEYQAVDSKLPILWSKLNPKLVVHVGVSHVAEKLTLETRAHQTGYESTDVSGKLCEEGKCCTLNDTPDVLETGLDVNDICNKFNTNSKHVQACVSKNAGRYLCEYIYFKSLSFNNKCTIFIHVPMLDQPYTVQQLADALILIINMVYDHLYNHNNLLHQEENENIQQHVSNKTTADDLIDFNQQNIDIIDITKNTL
ncbi:pyroglutamyl-peptidase 1 isoform X2 [Chrysoperla carnea]|uniref:pyroglutamyl-peptidase 1 isoform X2 n=1 Tax=Chrysoperla carnea TaxID=189513 RepID=UPI001D062D8D|nr:pyroglutamyl-peptidase 1 isoform X2 [Chrysoperla carnea]